MVTLTDFTEDTAVVNAVFLLHFLFLAACVYVLRMTTPTVSLSLSLWSVIFTVLLLSAPYNNISCFLIASCVYTLHWQLTLWKSCTPLDSSSTTTKLTKISCVFYWNFYLQTTTIKENAKQATKKVIQHISEIIFLWHHILLVLYIYIFSIKFYVNFYSLFIFVLVGWPVVFIGNSVCVDWISSSYSHFIFVYNFLNNYFEVLFRLFFHRFLSVSYVCIYLEYIWQFDL